MAASQRVSRGFHRLLFSCAVCAASQSFAAQITDTQTKFSMLCVAEKGTGFNWKDNDWVQTNYQPYSYTLTKVERRGFFCNTESKSISDYSGAGESYGCHQLKELGEKDAPVYQCREDWNKTVNGWVLATLVCDGGYTQYRAEVDGAFVITATGGLFSGVRDSVTLQIGKCSLLTGTPNEK